ncbi:MAG: HIT family protein [Propionibacteriaceae bacterium]|nr:HIT family protein [Propionibacteriaceae bacterium]
MTDCLFCRIASGEVPARVVYEDDTALAFLDIAPFQRGHTVVIPRRHVKDGASDPLAWGEVASAIVGVSQLVENRLGATAVNILSNAGADAGQSVFHFHIHVIPRYTDNPGMAAMLNRSDDSSDDLDMLVKLLVL